MGWTAPKEGEGSLGIFAPLAEFRQVRALSTPLRQKFLDKSLDFVAAAEKDEGNEFAAPPAGHRLVPIAQHCRCGDLIVLPD